MMSTPITLISTELEHDLVKKQLLQSWDILLSVYSDLDVVGRIEAKRRIEEIREALKLR